MKQGFPDGYYAKGFRGNEFCSFVRLILENANIARIKNMGNSTSTANIDLLLTYTIMFFFVRLLN